MSFFTYSAYGLGIHSTLALPGFSTGSGNGEGNCDLLIRHELVPGEPDISDGPRRWPGLQLEEVSPDEVTAFVPGMAEVSVRAGCEVRLRLTPQADLHFIQLLLCGPVLSIALYQRGAVVLHASAVEVDGGAVLFCGESGWGKSSLAAALQTRGHRIICDDVTALVFSAEQVRVPAGPGQVKLNADVVQTLALREDTLSLLHPDSDKQAFRDTRARTERAVPLRMVYFLEQVSETHANSSHALHASQAVMELLRFSYGIHRLAEATVRTRYFQQCATVARTAGMCRLERRRDLAALPALAERIEAEVCAGVAG
jgi:hypothetical protein